MFVQQRVDNIGCMQVLGATHTLYLSLQVLTYKCDMFANHCFHLHCLHLQFCIASYIVDFPLYYSILICSHLLVYDVHCCTVKLLWKMSIKFSFVCYLIKEQHKESSVPCLRSLMICEERMRPVTDFPCLKLVFLFPLALLWCWFGVSKGIRFMKTLCYLSPKVLFCCWNMWREKNEVEWLTQVQVYVENGH